MSAAKTTASSHGVSGGQGHAGAGADLSEEKGIVCPRHGKRIKYVCTFERCDKGILLCARCLIKDTAHVPQHLGAIFEIDEFFGLAANEEGNGGSYNSNEIRHLLRDVRNSKKKSSGSSREDEEAIDRDFDELKRYFLELIEETKSKLKSSLNVSEDEMRREMEKFQEETEKLVADVEYGRDNVAKELQKLEKARDYKGLEKFLSQKCSFDVPQIRERKAALAGKTDGLQRLNGERPRYKQTDYSQRTFLEVMNNVRTFNREQLDRLVSAAAGGRVGGQHSDPKAGQPQSQQAHGVERTEEEDIFNESESRDREARERAARKRVSFVGDQDSGHEGRGGVSQQEQAVEASGDSGRGPSSVRKSGTQTPSKGKEPVQDASYKSPARGDNVAREEFASPQQRPGHQRGTSYTGPSGKEQEESRTGSQSPYKSRVQDIEPASRKPVAYVEEAVHVLHAEPTAFNMMRHEKIIETDHKDGITCVCLIKNQIVVTGSADATIKAWHLESFNYINTLLSHTNTVRQIVYFRRASDRADLLVSVGDDKLIVVWNVSDFKNVGIVWQVVGHTMAVLNVAVLPNDIHFITCSRDQTIRLWDSITGEEVIKPLKKHRSVVASLAVMVGGRRFCSSGFDKSVNVWLIEYSGDQVEQVINERVIERAHDEAIYAMIASNYDENMLVTGGYDHLIKIWNVYQGRCLKTFLGHNDRILNFGLVEKLYEDKVPKHLSIPNSDLRIMSANFGLFSVSRDKTLKFWLNKKDRRIVINNPLEYNYFAPYNMSALQIYKVTGGNNEVTYKLITSADGDYRLNVFAME